MEIFCGTDIVRIDRMEKHLSKEDAFRLRVFTEAELEYCLSHKTDKTKMESLAARFAAKEAASKALGIGVMRDGIAWKDFEVRLDELGAPHLEITGRALEIANQKGISSWSISLAHDGDYAICNCTMLAM